MSAPEWTADDGWEFRGSPRHALPRALLWGHRDKTRLVHRRTRIAARRAARLTLLLAKKALGIKSTRRRSNGQNRQGKKCRNNDPHDYLLSDYC